MIAKGNQLNMLTYLFSFLLSFEKMGSVFESRPKLTFLQSMVLKLCSILEPFKIFNS